MNHFVYYTFKNDEPDKAYIGFSIKPIESGYKGSGKLIIKALKKYGNRAFTRINLGEFKYPEEALYWEGFYIKHYKTESKYGGYNIHPSGSGVPNQSVFNGEVWNKGKKCPQISGEKNGMYNKRHSKEAKRKQSEARKGKEPWNKGKTNIYSEETKKKMSNAHKGKQTWLGKHHSEETKKHLSEVRKQLYKEGKVDTSGEKNGMFGKKSWNSGISKNKSSN